jgi:hypothetical protein
MITVHGADKDADKWACLVADFDIKWKYIP